MSLQEPEWLPAQNYWPMVCMIESYFRRPHFPGGRSIGTGTLIGPRTILTAGHVLYDPDQGDGTAEGARALRVFVSAPGRGGDPPLDAEAIQHFATRAWEEDEAWWDNSYLGPTDVGLVYLANKATTTNRYPIAYGAIDDDSLVSEGLSHFSYPANPLDINQPDSPNHRLGDQVGANFGALGYEQLPGELQNLWDKRVYYPLRTVGGMSGGPVLVSAYDIQDQFLIGVHTSDLRAGSFGCGSGIRIRAALIRWINNNLV